MDAASRPSRVPYARMDHSESHSRESGASCAQLQPQPQPQQFSMNDDDPEVASDSTFSAASSSSSSFPGRDSLLAIDVSDRNHVPNKADVDNALNVLHSRHSYSPERKPSFNSNSGNRIALVDRSNVNKYLSLRA